MPNVGFVMRLLAVMLGKAEVTAAKAGLTGINKRVTAGPVRVGKLALAGDVIGDLKNHGGLDQAVYVYTKPDLDWWELELGRAVAPGTFGENLLISGLESAALRVGDRFYIGETMLEVTSPRIPCDTLSVRMGDPAFGKRFMQACRPGFYARVIEAGFVVAGNQVRLVPFDGAPVTLRQLFEGYPHRKPAAEFVARALAAPIHAKLRAQLTGDH